MTWVTLGLNEQGVEIFGRLDDDGLIRVTCIAEHPEFAAWLAEGNSPEPWNPTEV
jgi:hypothetical protein